MGWLAWRRRKLEAARSAGEVSGTTVALLHIALEAYPRLRDARLAGEEGAVLEEVRAHATDLTGLALFTAWRGEDLHVAAKVVEGPARTMFAVMQLTCAFVALGQRPVDETAVLSDADLEALLAFQGVGEWIAERVADARDHDGPR
jgi:hypothetical protein